MRSTNQHAIAVAIKTVLGADGVFIGVKGALFAGEGGDEGEERGFREVEVGEELVDDAEGGAGKEEEGGVGGAVDEREGQGFLSRVFKGANDGGADGEDGTTCSFSVMNGGSGRGGDIVAFSVELMGVDIFSADGLEGAEADFEGNFGDFDVAGVEAVEDGWAEV
jgi:hypothetical protein